MLVTTNAGESGGQRIMGGAGDSRRGWVMLATTDVGGGRQWPNTGGMVVDRWVATRPWCWARADCRDGARDINTVVVKKKNKTYLLSSICINTQRLGGRRQRQSARVGGGGGCRRWCWCKYALKNLCGTPLPALLPSRQWWPLIVAGVDRWS